MYGLPLHPVAPLLVSATVTVTAPPQLSASSVTAVISATGTSAIHCNPVISAGAVPVGAVVSSTVIVCTKLVVKPPQSVKV